MRPFILCLLVVAVGSGVTDAGSPAVDAQGDPLPPGALLRLGTVRWRADSTVVFSAFLPDQKSFLTVSQDYVGQIWDLASGKELRRLDLSGGPNKGTNPRVLDAYRRGAELSADGKTIACLDREGRAGIWDLSSGKLLHRLGHTGAVPTHLALSRDGTRLATVSYDRTTIWDTFKGTELQKWDHRLGQGEQFIPSWVELRPKGEIVLMWGTLIGNAGNGRACLQIWDTAKGTMVRQHADFPIGFGPISYLTAVSPDFRWLVLPDQEAIVLFDLESGKQAHRLAWQDDSYRTRFVFSPDSKTLLQMIGRNEALTFWDVATGKVQRQIGKAKPADPNNSRVPGAAASSLAVSPDGATIAWADGSTVLRMDLATGKRLGESSRATGPLRSVLFSTDNTIVTRGTDLTMIRWDAVSGREQGVIPLPKEPFNLAVLSRNEKWLAGGALRTPLRVLDMTSGKEQMVIPPVPDAQAITVGISPDSRFLATVTRGNDNAVRLYDLEGAKALRQLPFSTPAPDPKRPLPRVSRRLLFSPDSQIVAAGDTCVTLWNMADGRKLKQIDLPPGRLLRHAAIAPDHRSVAIELYGGELAVWEVATGSRRSLLRSASDPFVDPQVAYQRALLAGVTLPMSVAFSPDGRLLAQAGEDRKIRLFDVRQGSEVGTLEGHQGGISALAFSPDGRRLVSASADTTALVWDVQPYRAKLKPLASAIAAEQLPALWADLAQTQGEKSLEAIRKLAGDPGKALPFLRERHPPAVGADAKLLARLIANLDSDSFKVRDQARRELAKLGEHARGALTAALQSTSLEVRRHVEKLLANLAAGEGTGEHLRSQRLLEVLEWTATPEAIAHLQDLAKGAPGATVTLQAQAILKRVGKSQ